MNTELEKREEPLLRLRVGDAEGSLYWSREKQGQTSPITPKWPSKFFIFFCRGMNI